MRPTHRLDLLLVPDSGAPPPAARRESALRALREAGILARDASAHELAAPGPAASSWVEGGFAALRWDVPPGPTLYANRQGGFSVHCPATGAVITAAFSDQMRSWRADPRADRLPCPACGAEHPLAALEGRPAFALGAAALVTHDAESATLTAWAQAWAHQVLGPHRVVLRRG